MYEFLEEIRDEAEDFFEDIWEYFLHRKHPKVRKIRQVEVNGVLTKVRPAYLFAERIDNLLKMVFAASITFSAFMASYLGYTKLSDLLDVLIRTFAGRILMIVIGVSMLLSSFWKLINLRAADTA